jgi:class 3 adenylate cyclase
MLNDAQKTELTKLAKDCLNAAESIWGRVGHEFITVENARAELMKTAKEAAMALEAVETQIPGYPFVEPAEPQVDDFIALVADMRGSTSHLLHAISTKTSRVSQLQRVFYETSALLPSLAKSISYEEGKVTEYLGDGVLGLFKASENLRPEVIYAAHGAAKKCFATVSEVVNPILAERYSLPPLDLGIGMAFSKTVVSVIGLPDHLEAKVFGHCVYYATKLSGGINEIHIDEALKCLWPTTKDGILSFRPKKMKGVDGYLVHKNK